MQSPAPTRPPPAHMQSPAPMPVCYKELEGGHWTPPTKAQQKQHLQRQQSQQLLEQHGPQTSAVTRVVLLVVALLLVSI